MIIRCPKCSGLATLLERRRKYRCDICSKIFYKKEIEDYTFKIWNQRMRINDKHNWYVDYKNRPKKKRGRKQIFTPEEIKERHRQSQKRWQIKNKKRLNKYLRLRHGKLKELLAIQSLRRYWMKKQEQMAEEKSKNQDFNRSLNDF